MANHSSTSAGTTTRSGPSPAEALKPYQDYLHQLADSLGVAGTVGVEVQAAQATAYQRLMTAGEGLNSDLAAVQDQFNAEVNAALTSPLVERVQRTYQAMIDAYSADVAEAVGAAPGTEIGARLRRANEAHAQAVADLNTELARQLSASYQRYLSAIVRAYNEADLGRVLVGVNEDIVRQARAAAGVGLPSSGGATGTSSDFVTPTATSVTEDSPSAATPFPTATPAAAVPLDTTPGSDSTTDPWASASTDWETPEVSPWDDAVTPTWDEQSVAPEATPTPPPWEADPVATHVEAPDVSVWDDTPPPVWAATEPDDAGRADDAGSADDAGRADLAGGADDAPDDPVESGDAEASDANGTSPAKKRTPAKRTNAPRTAKQSPTGRRGGPDGARRTAKQAPAPQPTKQATKKTARKVTKKAATRGASRAAPADQ